MKFQSYFYHNIIYDSESCDDFKICLQYLWLSYHQKMRSISPALKMASLDDSLLIIGMWQIWGYVILWQFSCPLTLYILRHSPWELRQCTLWKPSIHMARPEGGISASDLPEVPAGPCSHHQWTSFKKILEIEEPILKFIWNHKMTNNQHNLEQEEQSWKHHIPTYPQGTGHHTSWSQNILQSYSNQKSMT